MLRVYKASFSEHQVYRYRITDEADQTLYLAEPTGFFLPNPTREVTLLGPNREFLGRVEPPDPSRWPWGGEYAVVLEGQESPLAVITEQWELVDMLLLRLPRYLFQWEGASYIARGSRFGERFYEIFPYAPEAREEAESAAADLGMVDVAELDLARLEEVAEKEERRWGEPVGVIQRPPSGPHYQAEVWASPLQGAPLLLGVLVILADLHLQDREEGRIGFV
ncbi:MAG: hypothetical protein H5T61_11925 [Thermoflexales bacterium]|nr:hypothetical protein [Thermoflexales bacterium]